MSTDLVIPGRVVLNGWRLLRTELPPMTQYDFHSVAYQVKSPLAPPHGPYIFHTSSVANTVTLSYKIQLLVD